jgi:hypothetical protein
VLPFGLGGQEGLAGMIGVDLIGQIRRAYFDQHRPIKEIVRTLSVSRATVRALGDDAVERRHHTLVRLELQQHLELGLLGADVCLRDCDRGLLAPAGSAVRCLPADS